MRAMWSALTKRSPRPCRYSAKNVDLPAPLGPASTTRTGRSSAAAARSDANGGTLNERPSLEVAERPAAIRRDLDHDVGILGVRFVERRASGADPGLDGLTVGLVHELREHGFHVVASYPSRHREPLAGALEHEHIAVAGHHLDRAPERGPMLDLSGDGAVGFLGFGFGPSKQPIRDLHRCGHGPSPPVASGYPLVVDYYFRATSSHTRRLIRPLRRENRSNSVTCQPYLARSIAWASMIARRSCAIRAVPSCHGPCTMPRTSHAATRTRESWRRRLTLPESPPVIIHSASPVVANQIGVRTSVPLRRNVARLT